MTCKYNQNKGAFTKYVNNPLFIDGPIIPEFVTLPHICLLHNIIYIEQLYMDKHINIATYDAWMDINSYTYVAGRTSQTMFELWHSRKEHIVNDCSDDITDHFECDDPLSLSYNETCNYVLHEKLRCIGKFVKKKSAYNWSIFQLCKCRLHSSYKVSVMDWKAATCRNNVKGLNKLFPFTCLADKVKTNLDVASLVTYCARTGFQKQVDEALRLCPVGMKNVTVTSMIMHAIGNESYKLMFDLMKHDKACCLSTHTYAKYFKEISIVVRRTHKWYNGSALSLSQVSNLSYWELATGRALNVADWAQEKVNRTTTPRYLRLACDHRKVSEATNDRYLNALSTVLDEIMVELVELTDVFESWPEFINKRHEWVSSGSAGQHAKVDSDSKLKLNKRGALEKYKASELIKWRDIEPKITASCSDKYESGKARALYGTDLQDYVIITHVIGKIETKMHRIDGVEMGVFGGAEVSAICRRQNVVAGYESQCTMLDYSDFNLQHTIKVQSLLFNCLKRRLIDIRADPDIIRNCDWTAKALLNQWCTFPEDIQSTRMVQGMFSGIRATSFINTILNVAYFRLASREVGELFNVRPVNLYNVHQGDDVFIVNDSKSWASMVFNVMQHCNFDFNLAKQLFDRSLGEFLRVLYTSEGAMGYLGRAIATIIIKPIQSTAMVSPHERASGLNSQVNILHRRGYNRDACYTVWLATVRHALSLNLPGPGGFTIPLSAAMVPITHGGLGIAPPGQMSCVTGTMRQLPPMIIDINELVDKVPKHMSRDWMKHVSSELQMSIDSNRFVDVLHKSNLAGCIMPKDRLLALRHLERNLRKWSVGLDIPKLSTSYLNMDEYLSSGNMDKQINILISELFNPNSEKDPQRERGLIAPMFQAIRSSPFRDLTTACLILRCNRIEAARICITSAKFENVAANALYVFESLIKVLGSGIVFNILCDEISVGPALEARIHPVMLSWCGNIATEIAVEKLLLQPTQDVNVWLELRESIFHDVITTAFKHYGLFKLSKY